MTLEQLREQAAKELSICFWFWLFRNDHEAAAITLKYLLSAAQKDRG